MAEVDEHFVEVEQAVRSAAGILLADPSPSDIPPSTLRALLAVGEPPPNLNEFLELQPTASRGEYWRGFPRAAPPVVLAAVLVRWASTDSFPVHLYPDVPPFSANDLSPAEAARLNAASPQVVRVLFDHRGAMAVAMARFLRDVLGASGITRCFGCRQTPGTAAGVIPPRRAALEAATRQPTRPGLPAPALTVGGRALEKHLGRRGVGWGECYWGRERDGGGGVDAKNDRADEQLQKVLDNAVWLNVAALPGGNVAVEARVAEGYGARWLVADTSFRGFVEPHLGSCPPS